MMNIKGDCQNQEKQNKTNWMSKQQWKLLKTKAKAKDKDFKTKKHYQKASGNGQEKQGAILHCREIKDGNRHEKQIFVKGLLVQKEVPTLNCMQ